MEFKPASSIDREYGTLTEIVGHRTHNKQAGTVTDDTDLALCVARGVRHVIQLTKTFQEKLTTARFDEVALDLTSSESDLNIAEHL